MPAVPLTRGGVALDVVSSFGLLAVAAGRPAVGDQRPAWRCTTAAETKKLTPGIAQRGALAFFCWVWVIRQQRPNRAIRWCTKARNGPKRQESGAKRPFSGLFPVTVSFVKVLSGRLARWVLPAHQLVESFVTHCGSKLK